MVCAADPGEDSCQGDSGGPLTIPVGDNNQHTQIGITSFGAGCAVVILKCFLSSRRGWFQTFAQRGQSTEQSKPKIFGGELLQRGDTNIFG